MADFDRIDLMNFLKYGNDFDEQWDEIRNYIKTNPSAQRELEDIRKTLPQSNTYNKRRAESFERSYSRETSEEVPSSPSNPREPYSSQTNDSNKKWWSKLLGED
jgi:uncharacterized protein YabN with tetrapyrrole methylase and pyrophosphatase domain